VTFPPLTQNCDGRIESRKLGGGGVTCVCMRGGVCVQADRLRKQSMRVNVMQ